MVKAVLSFVALAILSALIDYVISYWLDKWFKR